MLCATEGKGSGNRSERPGQVKIYVTTSCMVCVSIRHGGESGSEVVRSPTFPDFKQMSQFEKQDTVRYGQPVKRTKFSRPNVMPIVKTQNEAHHLPLKGFESGFA